MTRSSQRTAQRAEDQWWDWALDEAAGGAAPPDFADRVRSAIELPRPVPHGAVRRHWFAAACVLLGVGALAGVAWLGRASSTVQPAQQPTPQQPAPQQPAPQQPAPQQPAPQQPAPNRPAPGAPLPNAPLPTGRPGGNTPRPTRPSAPEPEPGWVIASSADELAKVPDDCGALKFAHADAGGIASLSRMQKLERLDLSALPGLTPDPVPLTEDALRAVATLTTLHELRLRLRGELQPRWLAQVAALPQLETLLLDYVPIDDAGAAELAKLSSLRRLDLGFSAALTDQGVREITSMAGLRSLSLRGCGQLTAKGLAELGRLQQLELLDLGSVAGLAAGPGGGFAATAPPGLGGAPGAGRPLPAGRPQPAVPLRKNPNSGAGVGDETLAALAGCAKLRDLRLGGCPSVTPAGLEQLRQLPLRALDLYVTGSFGPFLRVMPPTLESLTLAYCRAVTDADLQELGKQLPMLRRLDLSHCTSITDAGLAALFASLPLRELHLRGCSGLTANAIEVLVAAKSLEVIDVDGTWVDDEVRAKQAASPSGKEVRAQLADIEKKLAGAPTLEVLEQLLDATRPHTELGNRCTDLGGDVRKQFEDLRQQAEVAYVDALRKRAIADADAAKEGAQLARYGVYEDVVRKLREDANDAKDEAKSKIYGDAAKEIFAEINRKVEQLFTPEYVVRVRPTDLLSDPGNWEVAGRSDVLKFECTGRTLVMTNEGDAAKFGGLFYKAGRNWRDYVVELEFQLDAGAMTFYTRAEVMDVKHAPGISIGKEKCDVNGIDYGRTKSAVICMIGGRFTVAIDGQEVKDVSVSINFARKGPVAIAVKPGTRLTISKFLVRCLR